MQAEQLYGIWELISAYGEFENGDGTRLYTYGEDAVGRLTYHAEGYVNVIVNNPNRENFGRDVTQLTGDEAKATLVGFLAYGGTFTLDMEQSIVTHHVTMAHDTTWVGTDQVRFFTLTDKVLQIRSAPVPFLGKPMIFYVDWRKLL